MPSNFLHFCYPLSVSSKVTVTDRYLHLYFSFYTIETVWYVFFFLPAGLHLHSLCFLKCTNADFCFSLWQRKADLSKSDSAFEQRAGNCHTSSIHQVFGMAAEQFWALPHKHTLFPSASSTASHTEYKLIADASQCWFIVPHAAIVVPLRSHWIFVSNCMFTHILSHSLRMNE